MKTNLLINDDCKKVLKKTDDEIVDLIYLDPPFFTQSTQRLCDNEGREYSFSDSWRSMDEYIKYISERLIECRRVLKDTGSIFVHCDRNASHYIKIALDKVFGEQNFQSEIVWSYKRWSNSKKGLLNNHQIIFFFSKTSEFKFNTIYTDYSDTTNVDQILQDRVKDKNGKSRYKINDDGDVVLGQAKKGVPLSDVWEIPYLNPKAKERVGYPTQKPIILLEQIIKLVTDEGDLVLDPFMGSGTTLVAAKLLGREYIGIDISQEAVELAESRLNNIVKTNSNLLKRGREAYRNLDEEPMQIIRSIDAIPVQRNKGIDGFMKNHINDGAVAVRVQRDDETLIETVDKLVNACRLKHCSFKVLIRTHRDMMDVFDYDSVPSDLLIIDRYDLQIENLVDAVCINNKQESMA